MRKDTARTFSEPAETSAFSPTRWTLVLAAGDVPSPASDEALEDLCRMYWYPLYVFVRRKGHVAADAEDLTQEFFAHLLERRFPSGVRPEGGKFRSFLLRALQNFLTDNWRRSAAAKRGGGEVPISLQELDAEGRYQLEPADDATPEALYDRRWASVVLQRCRQQLRGEYSDQGKENLFEKLEPCLTGSERFLPYREIAESLRVSEGAVKMAVHRLRRRYGEVLRAEIAHTVVTAEAVEEELRALLAAL